LQDLTFHARDFQSHVANGIFGVGCGVGFLLDLFELFFQFVNRTLKWKLIDDRHNM